MSLGKYALKDGTSIEITNINKVKKRKYFVFTCEHKKIGTCREDYLVNKISCGCVKSNKKSCMIGKRYGRLIVLDDLGERKRKCICDCGKECIVNESNLYTGNTKSCGCFFKERAKVFNIKHGACSGENKAEYGVWSGIKARCYVKSSTSYIYYGAKGIKICDRWRYSFENFLEDMGKRPKGRTIGRIDNSKGYCLENCRWETPKEQANNRGARKDGRQDVNCSVCNKTYRAKRKSSIFCSSACFGKSISNRKSKECAACNAQFFVVKSNSEKKYCSHKCYWTSMKRPEKHKEEFGVK